MRSVIKGRRIVEDRWQSIADDAELPAGAVIVALARWRRERAALLARDEPVGVRLPNTADVTELAEDLPKLAVVALEFPKFSDGRAYSQARLLRERFGYRGEIRAVGDVLRDQLFFMARSASMRSSCARIAAWKKPWRRSVISARAISRRPISRNRCTGGRAERAKPRVLAAGHCKYQSGGSDSPAFRPVRRFEPHPPSTFTTTVVTLSLASRISAKWMKALTAS